MRLAPRRDPRPVEVTVAAVDDQRLNPEHRILCRRDFLRVYQEGRRTHGRLAVVFCLPREGTWRLGLTVTKKTAGSVMRNLLRRRVREYFRRFGRPPEGWDLVVNLKAPACRASGRQLWDDLAQIMGRMDLKPPVSPQPIPSAPMPSAQVLPAVPGDGPEGKP